MPPGLLDSQFKTLEPPDATNIAITVSIDAPVEAIVDDIVRQLKLDAVKACGQERHDPHRARCLRRRRHAADQGQALTDGAKAAVQQLHEAGIGFTITSSRPTIGMRFLIEPLAITLPIGAFNGSSIVDPALKPVEQHLIPRTRRSAASIY